MEGTESVLAQTTIPNNVHTSNIISTNILVMADKNTTYQRVGCITIAGHYPTTLYAKSHKEATLRRTNPCNPAFKLLNDEKTSDIQKHKQSTYNHTKQHHNIQPHPDILRIVSQTIRKHFQTHNTQNKQINWQRNTKQWYNITPTTTHVQEAIKQSKNNNSQGLEKLNIRHQRIPLHVPLSPSSLHNRTCWNADSSKQSGFLRTINNNNCLKSNIQCT